MGEAKKTKTRTVKKVVTGEKTQKREASVRATNPNRAKVTVKADGKFAEGLCFQKLFFIFLLGSVLGTIYEDVLIFVQTYLATGVGVWETHRGVIYGPFNVIYGFGAALMCWLLLRKKYQDWQIFVYAALLGGIIEYLLSFFQELVTHTTSWDYGGMWLNINGRTTVPIMMIWGVMGWVLVKVIYPVVSRWIERIPPRYGNPIFWVLLCFMIFNCLISWTALVRQNLRHHDIPPFSPIGEFYDEYYNDEFLAKYYTNMVRSD